MSDDRQKPKPIPEEQPDCDPVHEDPAHEDSGHKHPGHIDPAHEDSVHKKDHRPPPDIMDLT